MQKGKGKPAPKLTRENLEQKMDKACSLLKDISIHLLTQKSSGKIGSKPCRKFMD
jgi:hypothetical protein